MFGIQMVMPISQLDVYEPEMQKKDVVGEIEN